MKKAVIFFASFTFFSFASFSFSEDVDSLCSEELASEDPKFQEGSFQDGVLQIHFVKRLEKAVKTLRFVHERNVFHLLCDKTLDDLGCDAFESLLFEHEEIEACRQKIEAAQSLEPFFELWDSVQARTPFVGISFLRELAIMILGIYRTIYTAVSPVIQIATQKNFILHAVTLLCGNISTLNAFELLSVIDKLTVQIPKLLEKYELAGSDLTWNQWFEKYWWLPPVGVAAVVAQSIILYQVAVGKQKLPKLKSLLHVFSKKQEKAYCGT